MNIFYLHESPAIAATMHCDQHVRKMLIESAQMLSTAHRLLDGKLEELEITVPINACLPIKTSGRDPLAHILYRKTRKLRLLDLESAQLTAWREAMFDGRWHKVPEIGEPIPNRLFTFLDQDGRLQSDKWNWRFELQVKNKLCCFDTHANHGSAVWARETASQYMWLFKLYEALNDEFVFRFGAKRNDKDHQCWLNWHKFLENLPNNIPRSLPFREPPQMMPDEYKNAYAQTAYRTFYCHDKSKFATWTRREIPAWYKNETHSH